MLKRERERERKKERRDMRMHWVSIPEMAKMCKTSDLEKDGRVDILETMSPRE